MKTDLRLQTDDEDANHTVQVGRLIFTWHTCQKLYFPMLHLIRFRNLLKSHLSSGTLHRDAAKPYDCKNLAT